MYAAELNALHLGKVLKLTWRNRSGNNIANIALLKPHTITHLMFTGEGVAIIRIVGWLHKSNTITSMDFPLDATVEEIE